MHLYKEPLNYGKPDSFSLEAKGGNPVCGDKVHLFIQLDGNKIKSAYFTGQGCAISTAAASVLTGLVKGKTVSQVLALKPEAVFKELGGVIQTRIKCATLALFTLQKSLRAFQEK